MTEPPRIVKSVPVTTTRRPSMRPSPPTVLDGGEVGQFAVGVFAVAHQAAQLLEAAGVEQGVDALADGQLAVLMLPRDGGGAAHRLGQRLASGEFVEFGVPGHGCSSVGQASASGGREWGGGGWGVGDPQIKRTGRFRKFNDDCRNGSVVL